ncbi:MAG: protein kinase [Polyangiaceae bacterium]
MMHSAHPLIGRTLEGRFRLTGFIGEGAMATVFRGVDQQSGGDVAVKVMHPHLAEDRTFAGRFRQEAKAAAMLTHPNSVRIIHFGEDNRVHYIAMELVSGRDLRDVLKLEKRLSEARAATIVANVCDALDAAHRIGIVHRDLKPENIMVLPDDKPGGSDVIKVLDFGIAKLVDKEPQRPRPQEGPPDSEPPPALTQVGVVVGTPAYMSPEQCRGQPLDGRSDLYTCGILLYQLTTGRVPFDSPSPFEVAGKQAFEPPAPPSQHLPTIFPPLEALILKVLSKAPADRPQTALELRDALRDIHAQLNGGAADGPPGRAGKTIPLMASHGIVEQAEAIMAARRANEAQGAPPGVVFSPPPNDQPPMNDFLRASQQQAPGLGAFQPPPPQGAPAPHNASAPQNAPPPHNAQLAAMPGQPGFAPTFQPQGPPGIEDRGQNPGPVAPPSSGAVDPPKRGPGGVVTFLAVLISMGAGVGVGYALFHFIGM